MDEVVIINGTRDNAAIISSNIDTQFSAIIAQSSDNSVVVAGATSSSIIIKDVPSNAPSIIASIKGMQGPSGPLTGVPTFIQSTAPTALDYAGYTKYAWFDTSGGNLTLWIEDGV